MRDLFPGRGPDSLWTGPQRAPKDRPKPSPEWQQVQQVFLEERQQVHIEQLAWRWRVSPQALDAVGLGWSDYQQGYTFPERDGQGTICAIHVRHPDGHRWMVPFSDERPGHRGLYLPQGWYERPGPCYLPEGVSDVCSLYTHGLCTVGRPSCTGGVDLLAELLQGWDREVVILGEHDQKPDGRWPGRDGAQRTAAQLTRLLRRDVAWMLPPDGHKDMRDFFSTFRH
jgi:hypothetical protein